MEENGRFDVCIIGSGFAGSVIANELAATGKRIAIIEAGDWDDRQATQLALMNGRTRFATPAELHVPISIHGNIKWRRGWSYGVGGHVGWTAWTPRPLENHFQTHTKYGVGEDWPIRYDDLEPDYCRAEDELGVSGNSPTGSGPRRSRPYPMPAMPYSYAEKRFVEACTALGLETDALPVARNRSPRRGRDACCFSGTCNACPTTAKYRADLVHVPSALAAKNVTLLTRHVATKLVLDARGRLDRLVCGRPDRTTTTITAGVFIVACNTIESTRLLLGSAQPGHPQGLANRSGVAGRYLIDHADIAMFGIAPEALCVARSMPSVLCRHYEDGEHRRKHGGFFMALGGLPEVTGPALELVNDRGLFGAALKQELLRIQTRAMFVGGSMEMLPVADNRVELDPSTRDSLGRPGLKVTMSFGEYEKGTLGAFKAAGTQIMQKMGCTDVDGPGEEFACGFHQMGTLRMGKDPARSVLDANLRAHDVDNLFVASSAAFPNTLGAANPTLTLVALSLRLARHLRQEVLR